MSLLALYINNETYPGKTAVIHALGGNLCRCTGYSPILKAAEKAFEYQRSVEPWSALVEAFKQKVLAQEFKQSVPSLKFENRCFYLPQSLEQLLTLKAQYPKASLVAGGTDISIEFSQNLARPDIVISVAQVSELTEINQTEQILSIGAAATYNEFVTVFCAEYPEAKELFERLGSAQVRNSGTLGGSLGNASPIGDPAPLLIALDATLELASAEQQRTLTVEEFFTGYRQTKIAENEVITRVNVPKRSPHLKLAAHKISKRFEDDISTACLVLAIECDNGLMTNVRCAMGGMAAVPARAHHLEQQLVNARLEQQSFCNAGHAIAQDFTPMSDVRASADYRLAVCKNLLVRIGYEFCERIDVKEHMAQTATRIAHASL
jgi:xanthine dehydrogenase small subunit